MSAHGWLMWLSWTVIAMAQIITARYNKHQWHWSQFIHNTLGAAAAFMTATAFFIILVSKNWTLSFREQPHSKFGVLYLCLTFLMIIAGVNAWLRRRTNHPWSTKSMLMWKRVHKFAGYFVFFTV